ELMPRGVNSPLHAFKSVGRQPIIMDSVKGSMGVKMGCLHSKIRDINGNEYIDYVGSWGPAIIGHANDKVLAALVETMKKGTGFGARCLLENDLEEMVILVVPREITAVILEPVVGNSGFITPKPGFLEDFQKITKENDALLIFDEIMTRFRLSYGGAQEYFGITPDLTTLGKIISGGLQVGAYGERKEIMEMVAPTRPMYQADTLSGNPLTMTVGIHTLKLLKKPESYEYLNMITKGPVYEFEDAKKSHTAKFAKFYRGMLEEGVYFVPSQFGAGFTSFAHTLEDVK
ncbi:hypothetical protein LOK49_LG04G02312, partial [Camellia lanceoleosa]